MNVCRRVFLLRKMYHYTQKEIGKRLGISQPAYSLYETGRINFNTHTLIKLADIYQVSMDYLLCGKRGKK